MTLYGEGEPQPTLLQQATQAAMIALFTQWQTYRNGVHMDWDTFRSIDFRAIALASLTSAGFEITMNAVTDTSKLASKGTTTYRQADVSPEVTLAGTTTYRPGTVISQPGYLTADDVAEHEGQVQG